MAQVPKVPLAMLSSARADKIYDAKARKLIDGETTEKATGLMERKAAADTPLFLTFRIRSRRCERSHALTKLRPKCLIVSTNRRKTLSRFTKDALFIGDNVIYLWRTVSGFILMLCGYVCIWRAMLEPSCVPSVRES